MINDFEFLQEFRLLKGVLNDIKNKENFISLSEREIQREIQGDAANAGFFSLMNSDSPGASNSPGYDLQIIGLRTNFFLEVKKDDKKIRTENLLRPSQKLFRIKAKVANKKNIRYLVVVYRGKKIEISE